MKFELSVIVVLLILLFKIEFWMYRHRVNRAIQAGHDVTLGVFGHGKYSDYLPLIEYAKLHPNRVSLSVKANHMTPGCAAKMSRRKGVKIVWQAAKWPADRWSELTNAKKIRDEGGNIGFTVAAYNPDSLILVEQALKLGLPIRLVKGYYSSGIKDATKIRTRFYSNNEHSQ